MDICNVCSKPTIKKCGKCGLARYCRTECQRSDWKNHKKICKYPFEIKESEGKGLGMFATRNLEIGDLIVCEDPVLFLKSGNEGIMRNSHEFRTEYEKLERRKKDRVLALAGNESNATPAVMAMERSLDFFSINEEWRRAVRVYVRNSISVGISRDDGTALYTTISRINHDCSPNAEWSFLEEKRTHKEVRAIRKIKKGEEVLANYIINNDSFPTTVHRRQVLTMEWGFKCCCSLCSSDDKENDALRMRVQKLHDDIPRLLQQGNLPGATRAAQEKCQILERCEDMASLLPVAYMELYEMLISVANMKSMIQIIDKQIARLSENREEYREKAYELCKRARLINRKEMYNKKIKKFSKCGGVNKLI